MVRRVVWYKLADVSEMLTAFIISTMITLMMEAVHTSETSVNFYQTTRRNMPEDRYLHTRRYENWKSHNLPSVSIKDRQFLTSKTILASQGICNMELVDTGGWGGEREMMGGVRTESCRENLILVRICPIQLVLYLKLK
jgi:hypothetical protein